MSGANFAQAAGSRAAAPETAALVKARVAGELRALQSRWKETGRGVFPAQLVAVKPFANGFVQHWRTLSGMNVLLAPDSSALLVAYHTWIATGSRDETRGRGGVAHLLEHLMFKGTKKHRAGSFDRLLERHGAAPNAATWLDFTMYHQTVPPTAIEQVARLEADRLTGVRFGKVALRAELEVVLNERREDVDNDPDGALEEAFYRLAYGEHPYGRPVLGAAKDLRALTRADVRDFYRRHYVPSATTVVLVGAVEPTTAISAIVDAYGAVTPTDDRGRQQPMEATKLPGPRVANVGIDAGTDRLIAGWVAVRGDDPQHPLLTLAAEALAGASSTRLERALVDTGLAADVSVEIPQTQGAALLEVRVECMPGVSARQTQDALLKTMRALRDKRPLTADEVTAARNRLRRQRYATMATLDGRAEALGHAIACFGQLDLPQRWWQAIESATAQQVQDALSRVIRKRRRVLLLGRARSSRRAR